ncbi:trypsin-1-like [Athalia rosae]|uniref:trypsin-1-like n=1 Tax=Athalia rosae TaxID=37344 RepID=UPI0020337312|nr:trypsin-1-like [Athalia rosae]
MFDRWSTLSILIISSYGIAHADAKAVDVSEYPYHVSVEYNEAHNCAGVLLNEDWILTVASCVFRDGLTNLTVRVATSYPSSGGEQLKLQSVVIHDDFEPINNDNDIALLKLLYPLLFGNGKLPLLLPPADYQIADGTLAILTGWKSNEQGNSAPRLTVISTPIVNQTTCDASLPVFKELTDDMICAGHMTAGTERCQGDIGAPLVHEDLLVGVLSYGLGCLQPEIPAVYTRITSFVPWIISHTGNMDIF